MDELLDQLLASGDLEEQRGEAFIPSRQIDWSRCVDRSRSVDRTAFDKALTGIQDELGASEERQRQRGHTALSRFRSVLEALALDLFMAWKSDANLQLGISLNKNDYNQGSDYHKIAVFYSGVHLTYADVLATFKGLEQTGYLQVDKKGYFDREQGSGRLTRIRATEKLVTLLDTQAQLTTWDVCRRPDTPVIILKDDNKKLITYTPNRYTKQATKNLKAINKCISAAWVDLYLSDEELAILKERMLGKSMAESDELSVIEFNANSLRRIYNNGEWKLGGRFYGGWWQHIPSEYRKFIHINDKHTVELDYSGIHPVMMYAEVGETPPTDPYEKSIGKVDRGTKKLAFNKLVNTTKGHPKKPDDYDPEQTGVSWNELLMKTIEHHHPIRKFFRTGHGRLLQNKDAAIAETVMLKFTGMGYPCLPVHDSFIVHHALAVVLKDIMTSTFENAIGITTGADTKETFTYILGSEAPEVDMETSLQEMLSNEGLYQGYYQRKLDWEERHFPCC